MSEEVKKTPEEMLQIDFRPPRTGWMDTPVEFKRGYYNYPSTKKSLEYLGLPYPRKWSPKDDDWQLPEDWKKQVLDGMRERLIKYRSFKIFMDCCVRCGACADKCHFFLGSGDPKNMPVLRAELLRSIYKKDYTMAGKIFGRIAGARELTYDVIKEWFYYFYQCTECRRCSVFCPYGIDTAEITMMGRELLALIGVSIDWITTPIMNCFRTGNHLGILPHGFKDSVDFAAEDLYDTTGVKVEAPINKKGAEVLVITPSADYFADPHIFTFLGYLALFHEIGLDYTWSSFASEGGNFGLFHSFESMKRLNAKMYEEAERLGVKWILGLECGHMWRVVHQYMDSLNGPADFLEEPVSPITGTRFENAKQTKMVHIAEFTADLIRNNKLKLDPSRNDHWRITYHDSCNPARAMGLLEEPRYILRHATNNFFEMPPDTIREKTFCCGSGAGLGTDENMEMRLRGGLPRGHAVKYVRDKHDVNILLCMCAIDKATLPAVVDYWAPPVQVGGVHEMVGNALVMRGEKEDRSVDLRGNPCGLPSESSGTEEEKAGE
ncbi:MAG: (Fe-S)-binding protein [bacterium]